MDLSDGLADALRQVAAASGVGVRIDVEALPIDPAAREWWTARGVDPVSAAMKGGDDYELLFAVPARSAARCGRYARHVADPPLTKIGVFTKDPRELVIARAGKRTRYRKDSNTLRIAESYWKKAIATFSVAMVFVFAGRNPNARLAIRSQRADGDRNDRVAAGRRAPAVLGHGVLQGRDDGVRRWRTDRHRRGRSRDSSRSAASSGSRPRTRATAACGR